MLKEEFWARRTTAKIMMLKRYKSLEDSNLLEEIQRNNTREQKVKQELKKKMVQLGNKTESYTQKGKSIS